MQVEVTRPLKIVPAGGEAIVVNRGAPTLSYKTTGSQDQGEAVSATNRDGTLAKDASLTIRNTAWFISTTVKGELDVHFANGSVETIGAGEEQTVFTPNPATQQVALSKGTSANPDETYGPLLHVSRDISVPESAFTGDGGPGLTAIYGVTRVASTSQGQGIGVYGGAITASSYEVASLADGIGLYGVGRSTSTSTRTGMGLFANGRRESATGIATGAEIACDNETLTNGTYNASGASNTKCIFMHATGTANVGCGLQIAKPSTATISVGIGINEGAVTAAGYRDDSESERSILVKGTHSKAAIAVASGANGIAVGKEETANNAIVIELANAAAKPESNPASGGVLYAEAGALFWRSSAGKVTEVAKV